MYQISHTSTLHLLAKHVGPASSPISAWWCNCLPSLHCLIFSRKAYRQTSNLELQTFLSPPLKYWTAQELIFCPHHDWLEPPQWRPGEGPRAWGLQMTDHHPKHHLTSVCTLPSHRIIKGRSCCIQDQEQMTPAGPWCPWAVQAGLLNPLTSKILMLLKLTSE